jgi:hypothetical protein
VFCHAGDTQTFVPKLRIPAREEAKTALVFWHYSADPQSIRPDGSFKIGGWMVNRPSSDLIEE